MMNFIGLRAQIKTGALLYVLAVSLSAHANARAADLAQGQYLMTVAGCVDCHTTQKNNKKGIYLSGGRALKTPFGVYYSPNITPDITHGIGRWTEANFIEAMRHGENPNGDHYLPVFPYPSFTKMTDPDLRNLWAYLKTVGSVADANKPHQAPLLFRMRFTIGPWKLLNFKPGAFKADKSKSAEWNRGAYLANAVAHCGECHTPRNLIGGLKSLMHHAGTKDGPDGDPVPNITPDIKTGIGDWSADDLDTLFSIGMLPDGDFVEAAMAEVVENTAKLTARDRKALITYLMSVRPIKNKVN